MKKLVMTFAIVAFLFGGLSISANAQNKGEIKGNKLEKEMSGDSQKIQTQAGKEKLQVGQEKPQAGKGKLQGKEVNYDKLIKEFENAVNNYISSYEKALKAGTLDKTDDYMNYLKKAQQLQAQLDKAKDKMSKPQQEQYLRIKDKLAQALRRK